jgi:hypothetical protein
VVYQKNCFDTAMHTIPLAGGGEVVMETAIRVVRNQ